MAKSKETEPREPVWRFVCTFTKDSRLKAAFTPPAFGPDDILARIIYEDGKKQTLAALEAMRLELGLGDVKFQYMGEQATLFLYVRAGSVDQAKAILEEHADQILEHFGVIINKRRAPKAISGHSPFDLR